MRLWRCIAAAELVGIAVLSMTRATETFGREPVNTPQNVSRKGREDF